MAYLSDDLILDIKRECYLPSSQRNFTDAQLLLIADQELFSNLAPLLVSIDENFYVEPVDQAFTTDVSGYPLPQYAMAGKLKDVKLVGTDGQIKPLRRIEIGELDKYNTASSGQPTCWYFEDNQIKVVPKPSSSVTDSLRFWIYRRPGRLVATSAAAVVQSIAAATGVITYTAAKPSTFTSSSTHDAYSHVSPFRRVATAITATASGSSTTHTFPGPRTLGYDGTVTAFTVGMTVTGGTSGATALIAAKTSTTLTLVSVSGTFQNDEALTDTAGGSATANGTLTSGLTDTDTIKPGNYVCVQNETVFPAIPLELTPMLVDLVIRRMARTQMDREAYDTTLKEIMTRAKVAMGMPGNRVVNQPKRIPIMRSLVRRGRYLNSVND